MNSPFIQSDGFTPDLSPPAEWVLLAESDFEAELELLRNTVTGSNGDLEVAAEAVGTLTSGVEFLTQQGSEFETSGWPTHLSEQAHEARLRHLVETAQSATDSLQSTATTNSPVVDENLQPALDALEQKLVGSSARMIVLRAAIARVAQWNFSVLILGDSGTGKELVARAIHELSPRRDQPFIAENCGALNSGLYMSDIFGHEKGAFTNAVSQRQGMLERANGGVLFLDEIGTLPMKAQSALLRVLEYQSFERVGGTETVNVDVRIVAATNEDLEHAVLEGRFRQDLYYRLRNRTLRTPSLQEHTTDIPTLCENYFARIAEDIERVTGHPTVTISDEAMSLLQRYSWPGNVRQLQNILNAALSDMTPGENVIKKSHIPLKELETEASVAGGRHGLAEAIIDTGGGTLSNQVKSTEADLILEALVRNNWHKTRTAKELQISRVTLYNKIRKYGLEEPKSPLPST